MPERFIYTVKQIFVKPPHPNINLLHVARKLCYAIQYRIICTYIYK